MSRPFLALSVDTRQLVTGRDAPLSAEGQDDFGMDGSPSPRSQHSFGMDGSPSPQSQCSFGMSGLSSPQHQYSFGMGGSPSPQRRHSFGMDMSPSPQHQHNLGRDGSPLSPSSHGQRNFGVDKLPSPESQDNFGKDMPTSPDIQDQGTDPASRMEAPLVLGTQQPSIDPVPTQEERSGTGVSLPTEARETFGSHSAARTWNWGDRAPSPSNSEIKEGEVGQEEAPSELQEEYDLGTRVSILRAEAVRLRRIYVQAWRIYEREIALSEVVDAMVDELDNIEA
ncbi:hypothetical protein H4582DRAFT_2077399 [Lactarius indigo]|nr:hypothetical protein H4582DRAFT_2077399 [Lactarius indigo]